MSPAFTRLPLATWKAATLPVSTELDDLDAARRLELALGRRDDVDPPETGPDEPDHDHAADDPKERNVDWRRRRLQDFESGREKLPGRTPLPTARAKEQARAGRARSALRRAGTRACRGRGCGQSRSRRELHPLGLQIPEIGVKTARSTDQFVVRTDLDDAPVDHPDDPVAAANGRETVGDDDDRTVLDDVAHVALDDPFALIVERRSRLVEDENARIGRERPRQRDALTLAAGQVGRAPRSSCRSPRRVCR